MSKSLQTALRSLNTSPSACIEHMRKLLDQAWKTSTPNSLETRQGEIGTQYTGDRNMRPIQQPSREKMWKKGLQDANANHTQDTFPCLTCCSAWQYHHPLAKFLFPTAYTSLCIVIKPRPKLLTNY